MQPCHLLVYFLRLPWAAHDSSCSTLVAQVQSMLSSKQVLPISSSALCGQCDLKSLTEVIGVTYRARNNFQGKACHCSGSASSWCRDLLSPRHPPILLLLAASGTHYASAADDAVQRSCSSARLYIVLQCDPYLSIMNTQYYHSCITSSVSNFALFVLAEECLLL